MVKCSGENDIQVQVDRKKNPYGLIDEYAKSSVNILAGRGCFYHYNTIDGPSTLGTFFLDQADFQYFANEAVDKFLFGRTADAVNAAADTHCRYLDYIYSSRRHSGYISKPSGLLCYMWLPGLITVIFS